MNNSVTRYVLTKGFLNSEKQIVPFWAAEVKYESEYGHHFAQLTEDRSLFQKQNEFVECVYDMKTRELSLGIDINVYPDLKRLEFKVGQEVLFDMSCRALSQDKIKEIIFEECQIRVCRGKKLQDNLRKDLIPTNVELDGLYVIKHWEPTYVLESGKKTKYEHQLYTLVKGV